LGAAEEAGVVFLNVCKPYCLPATPTSALEGFRKRRKRKEEKKLNFEQDTNKIFQRTGEKKKTSSVEGPVTSKIKQRGLLRKKTRRIVVETVFLFFLLPSSLTPSSTSSDHQVQLFFRSSFNFLFLMLCFAPFLFSKGEQDEGPLFVSPSVGCFRASSLQFSISPTRNSFSCRGTKL
jgi:hypothetical protein